MRENNSNGIEETFSDDPGASSERVRVTDRRRVQIDAAADEKTETTDAPHLKPRYVEQLEERARVAEQKALEVNARFEQLRRELQRETDELRGRLNRAAEIRTRDEKAAFIRALLPVMDNLQRALQVAEGGASVEALLNGLRGTVNGFENALIAAGVEPFVSTGAQFDPELHEAVDTTEVEAGRDGLVMAEYSKGYKMGERLMRPARVQVGRVIARQAAER